MADFSVSVQSEPFSESGFEPSETQLHELLTTFMRRLKQAAQVSGSYTSRLEYSAHQMAGTHDLRDVNALLQDLLEATRVMARDSHGVHEELRDMQQQVQTTDQQIARLHAELDRLNSLARHDPLTGALNRKGLDESIWREVSRLRRVGTVLSVAMLDIDNFKALNDSLGHAAGDAALRHLAVMAREILRPQDTVARFGGEEFVVLLPDTPLEGGVAAVNRLAGELAKRPFSAADEALHMTFSAGVVQMAAGEAGMDAVARADQCMYQAKHAGKNRVVGR
jgi:diguanylate cyclase